MLVSLSISGIASLFSLYRDLINATAIKWWLLPTQVVLIARESPHFYPPLIDSNLETHKKSAKTKTLAEFGGGSVHLANISNSRKSALRVPALFRAHGFLCRSENGKSGYSKLRREHYIKESLVYQGHCYSNWNLRGRSHF